MNKYRIYSLQGHYSTPLQKGDETWFSVFAWNVVREIEAESLDDAQHVFEFATGLFMGHVLTRKGHNWVTSQQVVRPIIAANTKSSVRSQIKHEVIIQKEAFSVLVGL